MLKFYRYLFCVSAAVVSLCLSCSDLYAQEDTEFWFAVPRMLSGHNLKKEAAYHVIVFNPNSTPATIRINQPANSGSGNVTKTMTVPADTMNSVTLAGSTKMYPNADSVSVPFDVVSNRGLHVVSDVPVQCYFQVTKGNGEAYTLKGQNALGTEFVVAMQNKFNNGTKSDNEMYENAYSCIAIVAVEDNTTVNINPTQNISPSCSKSPISVTLNSGETYAFRACGSKGSEHPIGTVITSNKPIAVTYNDDSALSGSGADAIGEQLVPTALAGDKYVAVSNKTGCDYVFLIGVENGTTVTDNEGGSYSLSKGSVTQVSMSGKAALYFEGNKVFEIFQVTGVAKKSNHEMGGTMLPQISCTGSKSVSYGRINSGIILNLVTRNDNVNALSINGIAISGSDFTQLGSSGYSYFSADIKDKFGITDKNINVTSSGDVFQMGVLDYNAGNTVTYGYFSSYSTTADVVINGETADKYTVCRDSLLHITINSLDKNVDLSKVTVRWYKLVNNVPVLQPDLTSNDITFPAFTTTDDQITYIVEWESGCGTSSKRIILDVTDCTPLVEHPFQTGDCDITVTFAPGNLQYQASTNTWRFAANQWETIGASNTNISPTYTGWIDLFGWATGNNPTKKDKDDLSYGGTTEIVGTPYDWGSNTISNGNGAEWHSLTYDEWEYILTARPNADNLRGGATVNNVKGVVILPNDWVLPEGIASFKPGAKGSYSDNVFSANEWAKMQKGGAIFLPVTGTRNSSGNFTSQDNGYYWTGSPSNKGRVDVKKEAWDFYFFEDWHDNDILKIQYFSGSRSYGDAVRLVKYVNKTPHVGYGEETVETCNGSYKWALNGVTYTESGEYEVTVTNPKTKCDSVVTLYLTVGKTYNEDTTAVECDEFTWYGKTYKTGGTYVYYTKTLAGCDSIVTLHLTINKSEQEEISAEACNSYYWAEAGQEYTQSGDYTFNTTTEAGCPRNVILHLTINESKETHLAPVQACDSYTWEGQTYTESGVYTKNYVTVNGCDSIVYLDLTINHSYKSTVDTIVCDSFTWHGTKYYFDEVNPLNNIRPSLYSGHTVAGCDSIITYNFTICKSYHIDSIAVECEAFTWYGQTYTQSGKYYHTTPTINGCDSTIALDLTILQKRDTTFDITICPEYSYVVYDKFGGKEPAYFYEAGLHTTTISSRDGCDSVVNVNLSFFPNDPVHVYDTICKGGTYSRNGFTYTEEGDYQVKLLNENGCEYYETLHLAFYPTYNVNVFDTICDNEVYEWEGSTYTHTTSDTKTLKTIHGCDSVVTLYLQVWQTFTKVDELVLCEGESFAWGDYNIPSVKPSDSKTYSYTFPTIHGCDSVVALSLIVNPVYNVSFDAQICDNEVYRWQGDSYVFENNRLVSDTKTLTSVHGCDSVVTMNLRFNETKQTSFNATICDNESYEWNGQQYTTSGMHTQSLLTSLGCDSVVTLNLTVNPTYTVEWSDTILENQSLTWEGTTYTEAGDFTKTLSTRQHCDSVVTLHLAKNLIDVSDLGYSEFCVERDSAGMFTIYIPTGHITSARLKFSDAAHRQGVHDTIVEINGSNQPINVVIPMAARAGVYDLTVDYYFRDKLTYTQQIRFNVLFPSQVLLQKWNDFIGVQTEKYNGGYTFTAFEWYKNGEVIPGETGSYLYQWLEIGAAYSALLTDTAGVQLFTCPIYAVDRDDIGLYPTVVRTNNKIRLHVTRPAELRIYDATGKLIDTQSFDSGETEFHAPQQNGMYIMRVQLDDNETERTYKVVVQ